MRAYPPFCECHEAANIRTSLSGPTRSNTGRFTPVLTRARTRATTSMQPAAARSGAMESSQHKPTSRENEPGIAICDDLIAAFAVAADTCRIKVRQKGPWFALDVGPHIPRVRSRNQRVLDGFVDVLHPMRLRLRQCLDG